MTAVTNIERKCNYMTTDWWRPSMWYSRLDINKTKDSGENIHKKCNYMTTHWWGPSMWYSRVDINMTKDSGEEVWLCLCNYHLPTGEDHQCGTAEWTSTWQRTVVKKRDYVYATTTYPLVRTINAVQQSGHQHDKGKQCYCLLLLI